MQENLLGLIIIATGKYDRFIEPLLSSADKYLLLGHNLDIYLMTDKPYTGKCPERFSVASLNVPHLPWPCPTLYRYKWITQYADLMTASNLYYLDVDMLFTNKVGEEILPDETGIVAVRHPGFYVNCGWGDHKTGVVSLAHVEPSRRLFYFAGGFQGGERTAYLNACADMSINIDTDISNKVMAQWHDESHWNHYLKHHPYRSLSPEYCMVEQVELRKKWGIEKLTPRIVALKKDHLLIRS